MLSPAFDLRGCIHLLRHRLVICRLQSFRLVDESWLVQPLRLLWLQQTMWLQCVGTASATLQCSRPGILVDPLVATCLAILTLFVLPTWQASVSAVPMVGSLQSVLMIVMLLPMLVLNPASPSLGPP